MMNWKIIQRDVVESTNDLAREHLLAGDVPPPFVVRSARQTKGRGRGANSWWSDEGSLTFTIAVRLASHALTLAHEPRLALATAVAIIEAIQPAVSNPSLLGIRWPNDVEYEGKKLGGILPERVETSGGTAMIVGIGLNVSTRLNHAPPEVERMAVSLRNLASPPDLNEVFHAILQRFQFVLPKLASDDQELTRQWDQLDRLRGHLIRIDLGPRMVRGTARGIDAEGALVLATDTEEIRVFGGRVMR